MMCLLKHWAEALAIVHWMDDYCKCLLKHWPQYIGCMMKQLQKYQELHAKQMMKCSQKYWPLYDELVITCL